jgi:hypothetical protein
MAMAMMIAGIANAQDFLGYNYSNYQTAGGMIFNPASIAESRYRVNVNLFSTNIGFTNNAYSVNVNSLVSNIDNIKEGRDYSKMHGSGAKNIHINIDMLAPSFMIDFGKKIGSIGFSSRLRSLVSIDGVESQFIDMLGNASHSDYLDQRITMKKLRLNVHTFADAGLTYARTVWETDQHLVKAGVTGKILFGLGGSSVHIDDLAIKIHPNIDDEQDEIFDEFRGKLTAVYSKNIDQLLMGEIDMENFFDEQVSKSVGFDLGVEYEWYQNGRQPAATTDSTVKRKKKFTPYTVKVSAAITDIGSLKYKPAENVGSYAFNGENKSVSDLDAPEGVDAFSDYIDYLKTQGIIADDKDLSTYRMKLPTALRLNVDWNAYKIFYVNAGTILNLTAASSFAAKYPSQIYITPRVEFSFGGVYSPVSAGAGNVNWGIGFNVGGFFIGSSSIISNFVKSNISAMDIHFGFAVPIKK